MCSIQHETACFRGVHRIGINSVAQSMEMPAERVRRKQKWQPIGNIPVLLPACTKWSPVLFAYWHSLILHNLRKLKNTATRLDRTSSFSWAPLLSSRNDQGCRAYVKTTHDWQKKVYSICESTLARFKIQLKHFRQLQSFINTSQVIYPAVSHVQCLLSWLTLQYAKCIRKPQHMWRDLNKATIVLLTDF